MEEGKFYADSAAGVTRKSLSRKVANKLCTKLYIIISLKLCSSNFSSTYWENPNLSTSTWSWFNVELTIKCTHNKFRDFSLKICFLETAACINLIFKVSLVHGVAHAWNYFCSIDWKIAYVTVQHTQFSIIKIWYKKKFAHEKRGKISLKIYAIYQFPRITLLLLAIIHHLNFVFGLFINLFFIKFVDSHIIIMRHICSPSSLCGA